jgi:peptide/nickel transport system substrate-binding protein
MGDDGYRTMPDGEPIGTLRLFARSESPSSLDTMEFFQEWLADIGIRSEVSALESSKLTDVILEGTFDAFQWGWYVEPDPTTMLSYLTCDQRGNWSDSWYCDEEYDRLYEQQQTELDPEARAETVQQMQEIVFMDAPYLVTIDSAINEAFRSDRFACLRPQPDPGGIFLIQYGVYNYLNMRPADEAGDCGGVESATQATDAGEDSGVSTGVLIGLGVVAALVVAGGVVLAMRRRSTTADRE